MKTLIHRPRENADDHDDEHDDDDDEDDYIVVCFFYYSFINSRWYADGGGGGGNSCSVFFEFKLVEWNGMYLCVCVSKNSSRVPSTKQKRENVYCSTKRAVCNVHTIYKCGDIHTRKYIIPILYTKQPWNYFPSSFFYFSLKSTWISMNGS